MDFKKEAFYLLRKATSMSFRQDLKSRLWQLRVKSAPIIRAWNGTYSASELEVEIRRHIPADFEILMVHSSLNRMFPMYRGTVGDLLALLLRIVGANRT